MEWTVLYDEEFGIWFHIQEEGVRDVILSHLTLLMRLGPNLGRPRVDTVEGSAFSNMKELRIQYRGDPWRILFAFDSNRTAVLLVGGNKTGNKRWYRTHIPIADERFRRHLKTLKENKGG